MLYKISEFDIEKLNISTSKDRSKGAMGYADATYLQSDKEAFELQTDWVTLGQYPLPGKKFVAEDAKSLNLTVPTSEEGYADNAVLSAIDSKLSSLKLIPNKNYHSLISEKESNRYLKFKLYLNTALFDKDKNRIGITSLFDFYKYLKEGKQIKIVFAFSKMWSMGKEYGFSLSVRRILLKDEVQETAETTTSFIDD